MAKSILVGCVLAVAVSAWGQTVVETVTVEGTPVASQMTTFDFIGAQVGGEPWVVKDAPYSAEGVTETTQVLADGTRIERKSSSKVYRDSEGRVRREQTQAAIGGRVPNGEAKVTVTIDDPVAGMTYILDPDEKTVRTVRRRMSFASGETVPSTASSGGADAPAGRRAVAIVGRAAGAGSGMSMRSGDFTGVAISPAAGPGAETDGENLGRRMIEGVLAEGHRVTTTIPTGSIGNDRPITTTRETWYSQELQTVVLSETRDPMGSDTTFRLTNVRLEDPPGDLFQVPSDYTEAQPQTFELRTSPGGSTPQR